MSELQKLIQRCKEYEIPDPSVFANKDAASLSTLEASLDSAIAFFRTRVRRLRKAHMASIGNKIIRFVTGTYLSPSELFNHGKCLMHFFYINHLKMTEIRNSCSVDDDPSLQETKMILSEMHQKLHSPFLFELNALLTNLELQFTRSRNASLAEPLDTSKTFEPPNSCSRIAPSAGMDYIDVLSSTSSASSSSSSSSVMRHDYSLPLPRDKKDFICPICLELLFKPLALGCSHMMCNSCACSLGRVSPGLGAKFAPSTTKCPLCRQDGVFRAAIKLPEIHLLIKSKYPECWKERQKLEEEKEIQRAKAYWDNEVSHTLAAYGYRV